VAGDHNRREEREETAMGYGNAIDSTFTWDPAAKGYIASGSYDWDECYSVSLCVTQGKDVAGCASGALNDGSLVLDRAKNTWTLKQPLEKVTDADLQDGLAVASALAVMGTHNNTEIQPISWTVSKLELTH
jgi:hypothetical protein